MKKCLLIAVAFFLPLVYGWSINSLPDPQADPQACGRDVKGWVCSPDGLVGKDDLSVIQGFIMSIYDGEAPYSKMACPQSGTDVPVELMAVIVSKVDGKGDPAMKVARFATGLHDRFGVGSKDCGSGAVIVLSVQDRQVYISTGHLVGTKLGQSQIDGIVSSIRADLRKGHYGKAMESAVIQVGLTLSGKVDPSDGADEGSGFDWGLAFFGSVIAGFFGLSAWTGHRRRTEQQNVRGRLRSMQRDLKAAKKGGYVATSCPVCLEDFTTPTSTPEPEATATEASAGSAGTGFDESSPLLGRQDPTEDAPEPSAPPLPSTAAATPGASSSTHASAESFEAPKSDQREPFMLPCGHTFCEPCISEWLNRHSNCPVCRQPASGAAPVPPRPPAQAPPDDTATRGPRLQLRPPRGGCRRGYGGYGGSAFGWHDGDFDLYGPELAFRLMRLRRYHPDYVTQEMVDSMINEANGTGAAVTDWGHHPVFVEQISAQTRSEMQSRGGHSSGTSFGGGHSSGGGGGSW